MINQYRVNCNGIFLFLVILQGTVLLLFCGWYVQFSPCNPPRSNDKVHVLLLSSWRSGSSFMGQVFNQHPSVFYLIEPGWHVWNQLKQNGARALRMALRDLLRSVFQCDFSVMESYLPENHKALFMWSHSRALCSPPACPLTPRNQLSNQAHCLQNCTLQDLKIVEQACGSYSHVVYKEVRIFELESLYPLLKDQNLDLRIIHLVRDPRGVVRSKEALGKPFESAKPKAQYQMMQEICRSHLRINERAVLKPPPFLKGRYKLVRYEDVTCNPLEEIESLYQFVGLEMTTQLATWIYKVTHGKGKGSANEAFKITSRSAIDVCQAWRTMLPHNSVKEVQEVCEEAMSYLGYRMVNSEIEQKSLYVDLLVPREQLSWSPDKTPQLDESYYTKN